VQQHVRPYILENVYWTDFYCTRQSAIQCRRSQYVNRHRRQRFSFLPLSFKYGNRRNDCIYGGLTGSHRLTFLFLAKKHTKRDEKEY
jgi:hypothetical protein